MIGVGLIYVGRNYVSNVLEVGLTKLKSSEDYLISYDWFFITLSFEFGNVSVISIFLITFIPFSMFRILNLEFIYSIYTNAGSFYSSLKVFEELSKYYVFLL